jgi:hypothetical protein
MRQTHADRYAQAFMRRYEHGRSRNREMIANGWLSDGITRSTAWYYQGQAIAVLIHKGGRWLFLRDVGSSKKSNVIFNRFNLLVRQYDLGAFILVGLAKKKRWAFLPKNTQHFIPWQGQIVFCLALNKDDFWERNPPIPDIVNRLQEIMPRDFTCAPHWEKDLLWNRVAAP